MCAEKTDDTNRKSTNSYCNGMGEMMKRCFSRSGEATDCCAHLKDKCGSGADSRTDCMAMFQQMQERCCGKAKGAQNGEGSGCSA